MFSQLIVQPRYGLSDIFIRNDGLLSCGSGFLRKIGIHNHNLESKRNNQYVYFDSCEHMQSIWYYLQFKAFVGGKIIGLATNKQANIADLKDSKQTNSDYQN